jgi:hypothetical protein
VRSSRLLMAAFMTAGTMVGCAATSHLAAVQPPRSTTVERPVSLPSGRQAHEPARQLGIDIDFYRYAPGENVVPLANADIAYVKSLHANALSVSFPFFTNGWRGSTVYGNGETPSAANLATLARAAKAARLYFSIRPLLDESSLNHKGGRTKWTPAHPAAWFASYERFLKPYAVMAQQQHIPEFFTGVEFDKINNSPYWARLDGFLRKYYHGTLAYANNWEIPIPKLLSKAGVVQTVDAYPPMKAATSASVASLTARWDQYLAPKARGIVISEIGIAAQAGAYSKPYRLTWAGEPLDPAIQARWFTAACDAMVHEKGRGIYFWSIALGQSLTTPPSLADPTDFVAGAGARAISACFQRLS